jgi:hypothetical protein
MKLLRSERKKRNEISSFEYFYPAVGVYTIRISVADTDTLDAAADETVRADHLCAVFDRARTGSIQLYKNGKRINRRFIKNAALLQNPVLAGRRFCLQSGDSTFFRRQWILKYRKNVND